MRVKVNRFLRKKGQQITADFSVIHWLSPSEHLPEDASYVLIKQRLKGGGLLCLAGAYEAGHFWDMLPGSAPLDDQTILGWAYLPFDDRLMAM